MERSRSRGLKCIPLPSIPQWADNPFPERVQGRGTERKVPEWKEGDGG